MLVDSHCHLDLIDPNLEGIDALLRGAEARAVTRFLCVAIGRSNVATVARLARTHPNVYATAGVHPNTEEPAEPELDELVSWAMRDEVLAVGETGLDYYRSDARDTQQARLRCHIRAALVVRKPLIIHTREAAADTLRILAQEGAQGVGGVMHCFVDDWLTAQAAMQMGFFISLSGIVTFRNADALREVARQIPDHRLLVETDAPYLAPVPHRGKTNQPAFVRDVAEFVAGLRGQSWQQVAEITSTNFDTLFRPG